MNILYIIFLIVGVSGCVHFVYEYGKRNGKLEGRQEILNENLIRAQHSPNKDLEDMLNMIG